MFFRRQEGEYRETDRVTRFKLIKSGKHWLRASTSQFGLFKVLRGGVDTAQVTTEVIEEQASTTLTGLDILKGIAAAGTVFGGAVATQTTVYANDALEKTVESNQTLANTDTVTLGNVKDKEGAQADSLSVSASQSQSLSEEASKNASLHIAMSETQAASETAPASLKSENAGLSLVSAETTSASQLQSQSAVSELSASQTIKESQSESLVEQASSIRKDSASAEAALSQAINHSLASLKAVEARLSQTVANTSSLADATATAAVATTVTAENDKKAQEDRKRLSKISATMGEYLAKSIGLPNTNEAVAKVNAAVTAIEEALKTPNADLTDVIKQATSAQNSIITAVQRASSGKNDPRNGRVMARGSSFRNAVDQHEVLDANARDYKYTNAVVGYVVTKTDAEATNSPIGPRSEFHYKEGTYLYATEGRQANERSADDKANLPKRVYVNDIHGLVYMKATEEGNKTHWEVIFNNGGSHHDNPYYYFTVPKGHTIDNMQFYQKDGANGSWNLLGSGNGDTAFRTNSKKGDLRWAVGNTNGVNNTFYYDNVAGVGPDGVGRGTITTLKDFAFNNPATYYQTDKIPEKTREAAGYAFSTVDSATQNIYALHPKGSLRTEGYKITYTTTRSADANKEYMAGFRSLENSRHKNYLQINGSQNDYRVEFKTGNQKRAFLKWGSLNDLQNISRIARARNIYTNDEVPIDPNKVKYKVDGKSVSNTEFGYNANQRRGLEFSKGEHVLTLDIADKASATLPFSIVTQGDVYQPVINETAVNTAISKGTRVPDAASVLKGFDNVSSTISGFEMPADQNDYNERVNGTMPPNRSSVLPKTTLSNSNTVGSLNVANVQWLGGGDTFGSGVGENMAVKATVNGKTVYLPLPSDMPASKLGKDLTAEERNKVLAHNGFTASTASITSGKVGLSKTLVVTYKDNVNGDSQDVSEVFFENVNRAASPVAPTIQTPADGSVMVSPTPADAQRTADSMTVSYTPTASTTNTTINLKKSGNVWDNVEPLPAGGDFR